MNSLQIFADQLHGIDPRLLEGVVVPVLAAHAVELVDLSFRNERGWVLRVCVEAESVDSDGSHLGEDRSSTDPPAEEGAQVTLAQLTDISRDLSAALDVADIIAHRYSLEVSSPGLDRPLRGVRDFRRFLGRLAKIHLARPAADGQRVLRGRLVEVRAAIPGGTPVASDIELEGGGTAVPAPRGEDPRRDDSVIIAVEVDGKLIKVPLVDVARAHLVFEMPGQPKKTPNGPRKAHAGRPHRGPRDKKSNHDPHAGQQEER